MSKAGTALGRVASRFALMAGGLAISWLLVEGIVRWSGALAPLALEGTFDRPAAFFDSEPARRHPWSNGHPDPLRIVVIGDSFTDAQANHSYDGYGRRLEAMLNLNEGQRPVEVRVFAERGSSTRRQYKFLPRTIELEPEIVILGIFLNDTERYGDSGLREWRRQLRPRTPKGMLREFVRRSAAVAWVYQRLENARCAREASAYYRHIYDPQYQGFREFSASLAHFRDRAEEIGAHFLPVVFPAMGRLGDDYAYHFAHERIAEVCQAHALDCFDLLELFLTKLPVRMAAFPSVDNHPSEIAHRLIADAIYYRLLEDGALGDGYRPTRTENKRRKDWLDEMRRMRNVVEMIPD